MNPKIEEIRKRALGDHYYFCKHILNYSRMRKKPHLELSNFIINSKKRTKLILMPRSSFKSSVVTVGYSAWRMVNDPNIRVLISSETEKNAMRYVSEIKAHIDTNPKFRALFGDISSRGIQGGVWKGGEFLISTRTQPKKEATVTAGSLERGTKVGFHTDLIILDDVVSMNNIATDEAIQKTIDHYKLLLSILDPGGEIVVVGTRWGFYELYSWLLDPEGPDFSNVDLFHRAAEDDDGNPTMPDILSREFLDSQKKTQGEYIYNCQYRNKISSTEMNTFRAEQVQFYEKAPPGLIYFMTVDPAISLNARSDYSGLVVNGVDYYGNWWLQEAMQIKVEPSDLVDLIFKLARKYEPIMCLAMEKYVLEKVLKITLDKEMLAQNFFFPIKQLETNNRLSKNARIRALQPMFEKKQIFLKKEHMNLYNQLVYHPSVKHDDILDALKSQLAIVFPSDVKPPIDFTGPILSQNEKDVWRELAEIPKIRYVHQTREEVF